MGPDAARPYVDLAQPEHPSLIDVAHLVDERFGVVNIPNSIWIDEEGIIVRPAEPAWPSAPELPPDDSAADAVEAPPGRIGEMMAAASQIVTDRAPYVAALRDWVAKGADSEFALAPADVVARSGTRGVDESTAAAEFELAQHLYGQGDLESARRHFREAHRLAPDNWTYKRQAWSVEPSALEGPMARFWQGPLPGSEDEWAYEGDWVKDAEAGGIANYYPRFKP
jgi:tetratricopeptide (TPR) repeat protein